MSDFLGSFTIIDEVNLFNKQSTHYLAKSFVHVSSIHHSLNCLQSSELIFSYHKGRKISVSDFSLEKKIGMVQVDGLNELFYSNVLYAFFKCCMLGLIAGSYVHPLACGR